MARCEAASLQNPRKSSLRARCTSPRPRFASGGARGPSKEAYGLYEAPCIFEFCRPPVLRAPSGGPQEAAMGPPHGPRGHPRAAPRLRGAVRGPKMFQGAQKAPRSRLEGPKRPTQAVLRPPSRLNIFKILGLQIETRLRKSRRRSLATSHPAILSFLLRGPSDPGTGVTV